MTSIIKVDTIQTAAGSVPNTADLGFAQGSVIEEIYGICDGRTVNGVTFGDVDATQTTTTSYVDITGSSVSYTPPTGVGTVVYQFQFNFYYAGYGSITHFRCFLDSTEITLLRTTLAANYQTVNEHEHVLTTLSVPILIDSSLASDDVANAKLKSWTSAKTLKWQARAYSTSYDGGYFHRNHWWDGGGASGDSLVRQPHVTLKAIR
jgi:hypothetical protein